MSMHVTIAVESQFKQLRSSPKKKNRAPSQLLKLRFNCDGHIFISFYLLAGSVYGYKRSFGKVNLISFILFTSLGTHVTLVYASSR